MHEYRLPEGAHHHRRGSLRAENWVLCRIFKNSARAQRAGHDDDMESIGPLLPKTDDPGFRNWLRGAESGAQQEALELADSTCEDGRPSTTLPAMQMSLNRGGTSILELQTSATLQELGAGQTLNSMPSIPSRFQQSPYDMFYTSFPHLVKKWHSMSTGRSPFSDEVSQSTFHWLSVYGTKPLYPALGYDHHPDHFSPSNESSVLPSTTISVTTSEDELNSKTFVNSEPRFSMMGSQTCSISIETMPHDLRQYIKQRQKLGISCPFSVSAAIDLMFQISKAMVYMHSQRIAHRDLKAENILVAEVHAPELFQEGFVIAKLADFGMAEMKREVTAYLHMTPTFAEITSLSCLKDLLLMRGDEKLPGLYWGRRSFNSWSWLAKASATVNRAGKYDTEGIMTCRSRTQFVGFVPPEGLVHPVDGTNEHRRQTKKVNADAKLKGESVPALNEMGKRSSPQCHFRAQLMAAASQDAFIWAERGSPLDEVKSFVEAFWATGEVSLEPHHGATLNCPHVAAIMEVHAAWKAATAKPCVDESSDWVRNKIMFGSDIYCVTTGVGSTAYRRKVPLSSVAGRLTARANLTEDDKTTTALEALRMVGIAKPFELFPFEPARKRIRTRDWSAEEIRTMLATVDEALRMDVGPDIWGFVSDTLWDNYGFDRASNSCENLWGTLLQSHKATRDQGDTRASTGFELEFGETVERILPRLPLEGSRNFQMEMGLGLSPSAPPLFQFQSSASETGFSDSADCEEDLSEEETEDVDTHSDDEGLSGDSTTTIESQAEVSHVSRATEPWDESNSNYGRKRSAARVVEEDLISMIAPFVNRQIEDALKPLLSVLRRREEEQQNHREKLLALEQEKLALKREKMHFTRRV